MRRGSGEDHVLAAIGAAQGGWRYYVRPELTARRTWAAIGAMVALHELACPPNQLLSEGVDRALDKHRFLTTAVIGITALHLANLIPPQIDPLTTGLKLLRRL